MLVHPAKPFMIAHIDREILGQDAILEIKCPRYPVFRKWQLGGIPEGPQIQGQHYLSVKGKGVIVFAIFCAEIDEMMIVPIERDQQLIDLIEEKEAEFWKQVEAQDPSPFITPPEEVDLPPIGGDLVKLETDSWVKAVSALRDARELREEADAIEAEAKLRIQEIMDENGYEVVEGGGARIYWRWQKGSRRVDSRLLKTKYPDVYSAVLKETKPSRPFRPYFLNN
jgi:predicted phage-related endonuclease